MLFFCTTVQQKGLLKEQVITQYLILNLASWSVSANQCKYPSAPCPPWAMLPTAPGHSQSAATQEFPSHCTPHHSPLPSLCHLQILTLSNTLLSFSSALLYSVQRRGCLQLLQSSSAPLAARNRASGIPRTGSSYAGKSGVTPTSDKGSKAQREEAQVQISTPRTEWHEGQEFLGQRHEVTQWQYYNAVFHP